MSEPVAEPWTRLCGADAEYRAGAVDLLGILAYGALTAFERLAEDAGGAPSLADRVQMSTLAARQMDHFERVRDFLARFDVDVLTAMRPFHAPFDAFHAYTKPKDWLEGLVKAYVGDGFAADFYREVAAFVDADTRNLVHEVLADEGHEAYVDRTGAGRDRRGRQSGRPAGAVGPPTGRRGAHPGAAGGGRPGCADQSAHRYRRSSRDGSRGHQPDVLPTRRQPHPADGRSSGSQALSESVGPSDRSRNRRAGRSPRRCRGSRSRRPGSTPCGPAGRSGVSRPPSAIALANAFSMASADSELSTMISRLTCWMPTLISTRPPCHTSQHEPNRVRTTRAQHGVVERLRAAGCVFAEEEATPAAGRSGDQSGELEALVERRVSGVPLEQVLGWVEFDGLRIVGRAGGVRAPAPIGAPGHGGGRPGPPAARWSSTCAAVRGRSGRPWRNRAGRPSVYAADLDPRAVACARRNLPADRVFLGDLLRRPARHGCRGRSTCCSSTPRTCRPTPSP